MATLRQAKAAGIKTIISTSDNFNKYAEAPALLGAMADEKLELQFFCQCDTQIADQEHLMSLMAKATCWQIYVGVESFNRQTLLKAQKAQNHPEKYAKIVEMCLEYGVSSHLSNIIGFWDMGKVRRDHGSQYVDLRERTYGRRLFPLPLNLALSQADQELNRNAKLVRVAI